MGDIAVWSKFPAGDNHCVISEQSLPSQNTHTRLCECFGLSRYPLYESWLNIVRKKCDNRSRSFYGRDFLCCFVSLSFSNCCFSLSFTGLHSVYCMTCKTTWSSPFSSKVAQLLAIKWSRKKVTRAIRSQLWSEVYINSSWRWMSL